MNEKTKVKQGLFDLQKPDFMVEAAAKSKGRHWIIEILLFFVMDCLFMLATFGVSFSLIDAFYKIAETSDMVSDWAALIQMATFGGGALVILGYCRWIEKRKLRTMGFVKNNWWKELLIGLAVGFLAFTCCILLAALFGGVRIEGINTGFHWYYVVLMLLAYLIQGSAEEILVRGYFMVSFSRKKPLWLSVLISALLFALMHGNNNGMSTMASITLVLISILFALFIVKRGNIWIACGFHAMWNFTQGNIYGMSVSGYEKSKETIFNVVTTSENSLITGGDFGLEASLVTVIVMAVLILLALKMPAKDAGRADRNNIAAKDSQE